MADFFRLPAWAGLFPYRSEVTSWLMGLADKLRPEIRIPRAR